MAVAEGANGRVASPAPAAGSGAGTDRGTSDGGSSADRQADLEVMSPRRGFQDGGGPVLRQHRDQDLKPQQQPPLAAAVDIHVSEAHGAEGGGDASSEEEAVPPQHQQQKGAPNGDCAVEGFKKEMRDLEDLFSKLNPMAEEFVPPQYAKRNESAFAGGFGPGNGGFTHADAIAAGGMFRQHQVGKMNGGGRGNGLQLDLNGIRRRGNGYGTPGKRSSNPRTSMAQREEAIKRTVYVSDIDRQVTEEQLAALFIHCGQVVDCRICGDPNSILRFAFIEFTDEEGARAALSLAGTMLGYYPVRVLPSKTAIAPVNPTFLPRSEDEREMCARTVYCTNIDKRVSQAEVKLFFEALCGEVHRLRLLGDFHHHTRIAFVEFVSAESAIAALSCSGAVLRSLPVRVSPSKTPVRPRSSHSPMH